MAGFRDVSELNISAIVPAYNEARNILNVLGPLKQVSAITEIILVDDGSTDETACLAETCDGVRVVKLPRNGGKTQAAMRGVREAQFPTLLFCDADLLNMRAVHLMELIGKYREGWDMVIMDKGSQPWVFRNLLRSVPAVSGTRMLDRSHFERIPFRETDRFQFENRINAYFLTNGLSIAVSRADEVHDPRKFVKYPFWQGLVLDLKGGWQVLASDGTASIPENLRMFHRIRRLRNFS